MNHLSAIDPPLVGSFSTRAIWYMTKAELLAIPLVGEAFGWAGGSNPLTVPTKGIAVHLGTWLC